MPINFPRRLPARVVLPWVVVVVAALGAAGCVWVASNSLPPPLLIGIAVPHASPVAAPAASPITMPSVLDPTTEPVSLVPDVAGIRTPTPSPQPVRVVHVSTSGSDAPQRGSATAPWRTITYALAQAMPGTEIVVQPGTYAEHIVSVRNGTALLPISVRAAGNVVLTGAGDHGRIMELLHDYHVIKGFEFTGRDIQLWLQEADNTVITGNYFHGAQGECVRIKYQSTRNIFEHNRVEDCGREDFGGDGDGKNGEGVYIGTAPEQLDKNPTPAVDQSNGNIVRRNRFNTRGNECVDIKEGAERNIVEFNDCTGQRDVESGGMDSRGNRNVFRYNKIYGNKGAGIRFGGDTEKDGLSNEAYGNEIAHNEREAIKVLRLPQGTICGNIVRNNTRGVSNKKEIQNPACDFKLSPAGV